jgi:DNA-binding transcriptional ArsR family regulator
MTAPVATMTTPYTACCGQLAKTPKKWLVTGITGITSFIGSNLSSYAPTHRLAERVRKWGQTPLPKNENSRYIIKNKCSNYWCDMEATAAVLFGKTRQAVLALLFEQPEQACYLREIARQTGVSPGALQHELGQLQKADLVERIQDGNRVTYRANTAHPVFAELQSIVRKTCGLPAQIKAALQPLAEKIRFAALYGSLAKGVNHARSDVDLLIVGDLNLEQALAVIVPVEARIGRDISVRIYSAEDFRTRREQGEHFITNVMSSPLTPLIGNPGDA